MQRRAAAATEAAAKAGQKTRALRALLGVQEAAASALEAGLKKCEQEISEIQAEVQQDLIFELERSACRVDSGAAGAAAPGQALAHCEQPGRGAATPLCEGSEHDMQQDVVEGLESELQRIRECLARVGCSASAWELGFVLEYEAKIQAAKKVLHS